MKKLILLTFVFVLFSICLLCCSCSVGHTVDASGCATIVTVDTTVVNHQGHLYFKK